MGSWLVAAAVAVVLVGVLGWVLALRRSRRHHRGADERRAEEILHQQVRERLRQVSAQWDGPDEAATPAGVPVAQPGPPEHPPTDQARAGRAHVRAARRSGSGAPLARVAVAGLLLTAVVALALTWFATR